MPQPLLSKGQVVRGDITSTEYQVTRRLGEGQFAEVWEVRQCDSPDLRYALKVEKVPERKSVLHESRVLQKLPGKCDQVISVIDIGYHGRNFFMIMELLGDTLFDLRKQAGGRMDLPTVKAVGLSTLAAIEGLHHMGYIHRDIKPANFVINPPNAAASRGKWVLIDFGLARRYVGDHDGQHLSARPDASFRGSTAYASVHAHRNEDLSRRDDLWSWFYMVLELVEGSLVWRPERDEARDHAAVDKQWVLQEKERCMDQPHCLARSKLPDALLNIHGHLKGLAFADTPDYSHLRSCLQQLPDAQVELQLQHLIQQTHWGSQNGLQQAQQQQQHWDSSPLYQQQQQQQRSVPASPLVHERMSPAHGLVGVAAGTGSKRQRASSGGAAAAPAAAEQPDLAAAKRHRPDSSAAHKQSWNQQPQQQAASWQARHHGSSSSPCDADDSRGDGRQGSVGPSRLTGPHDTPAAAAAAAGGGGRAALEASEQQHKEQQQQPRVNGISEEVPPPPPPPPSSGGLQQQQQQGVGAGGRPRSDDKQAAAKKGAGMVAAAAGRADGGGGGGGGGGSGRAGEISELLTAYDQEAPAASKAATAQAVAGLCALGPLEAVCAISMTLDKLVKQSDSACLPAVSQLLLDLAAFATNGAAEASKAGRKQQQQQGSGTKAAAAAGPAAAAARTGS